MSYDPAKDALDPGSAINIADVNECGVGFLNNAANPGYLLDYTKSLTASLASGALTQEQFNSIVDGKATTSVQLPASRSAPYKYIYLAFKSLTRLNRVNLKTNAVMSAFHVLYAQYSPSEGSGNNPPTSGWINMEMSGGWNQTEGYTFVSPGVTTFDAVWVRVWVIYTQSER